MLTPVFELSQDDDFVVVIIKTPYVKVRIIVQEIISLVSTEHCLHVGKEFLFAKYVDRLSLSLAFLSRIISFITDIHRMLTCTHSADC